MDCVPWSKLYVVIWTTNLLQDVLCGYGLQHVLFGRLLDLTAHEQFVEDEVGLFKVENDIQLANLEE